MLALLALCACSRRGSEPAVVHQEQPFAGVVSVVQMADPKTAGQLLRGFHSVEQDSWRWTERKFSLALKVPASGKPGRLLMKFALPEALLARLRSVTVKAAVNGVALPQQTYGQPGEQLYEQPVPAEAMNGEVARVDFELDQALPPTETDRRELGLVVSSVGLE